MKYGDGSLNGDAGLLEHLKDIEAFLKNEKKRVLVCKTIAGQFNQLSKLNLFKYNRSAGLQIIEPPIDVEVIVLLANHNPREKKLDKILNSLAGERCYINSDHFKLRFYVASFAGYGIGRKPPSPGSSSGTHSPRADIRRFTPPEAYQLRRRREAILEREAALRLFVGDRLAEGWTPEQISGWLKSGNEPRLRAIRCETIYAFIYRIGQKAEALVEAGGEGLGRPESLNPERRGVHNSPMTLLDADQRKRGHRQASLPYWMSGQPHSLRSSGGLSPRRPDGAVRPGRCPARRSHAILARVDTDAAK